MTILETALENKAAFEAEIQAKKTRNMGQLLELLSVLLADYQDLIPWITKTDFHGRIGGNDFFRFADVYFKHPQLKRIKISFSNYDDDRSIENYSIQYYYEAKKFMKNIWVRKTTLHDLIIAAYEGT